MGLVGRLVGVRPAEWSEEGCREKSCRDGLTNGEMGVCGLDGCSRVVDRWSALENCEAAGLEVCDLTTEAVIGILHSCCLFVTGR